LLSTNRSQELFSRARELVPGGVNSPVRAFRSVGMEPLFIQEANGCKVRDVDGNTFIDYVGSWGPLILGHGHPRVIQAVQEAALKGTSYGAPCEAELEMAEMICQAIPSMEMVRMVNSGTEATMSAIRLARAFTGRNKIVKFEGCYHGHSDSFLIKAGSGLMTGGVPTSPGVPESVGGHTLVATYNDLASVERLFRESGPDIAAVIVEPIAGNMGLVMPDPQFLPGLRKITDLYGTLLIFDEVITGFRTCFGGFQNICGVSPDLTTLGKIIGGGLPVGAYGGKKEIMSRVAPQGDVYQAGTLSGNPLAMAAGVATLKILQEPDWYERLEVMTYLLATRLTTLFEEHDLYYTINHFASMFCVFFTDAEVENYSQVMTCDTEKFARFFRELLNEGIYIPPAQFEVSFVSTAHELEDVEKTITACARVLDRLEQGV